MEYCGYEIGILEITNLLNSGFMLGYQKLK